MNASSPNLRIEYGSMPGFKDMNPLALVLSMMPAAWGADAINPQSAPYNAKFDGRSDDTAALNAVFAAAAARGGVVHFPPGATTKVNGTLTLDVSGVGLDCQGATIDATSAAKGATFTLSTSSRNPARR